MNFGFQLVITGHGVGLLGLVAIKVLAPGFYASQNIKTPVMIAVAVLCLTQLMNLLFVRHLAHAGLALSIGLGAMINALWLLIGLIRRGLFKPLPGWGKFGFQVGTGSGLLGLFLWWAAQHFDWIALASEKLQRIGLLALVLIASGAVYFVVLTVLGVRLKQFARKAA